MPKPKTSTPISFDDDQEFFSRIRTAFHVYDGRLLNKAAFELHAALLNYLLTIGDRNRKLSTSQRQSLVADLCDGWQSEGRTLDALLIDVFDFCSTQWESIAIPVARNALTRAVNNIHLAQNRSETIQAYVTEPAAVIVAHVLHPFKPLIWKDRSIYQVTTGRSQHLRGRSYWSERMPLLRDANRMPMVLHEEIGVGSMVQVAVDNSGLMSAVMVVKPVWPDPFGPVVGRVSEQ